MQTLNVFGVIKVVSIRAVLQGTLKNKQLQEGGT